MTMTEVVTTLNFDSVREASIFTRGFRKDAAAFRSYVDGDLWITHIPLSRSVHIGWPREGGMYVLPQDLRHLIHEYIF